jgi:hypothetical protein
MCETTGTVLRVGYKRLEGGGLHCDIDQPSSGYAVSALGPGVINKVRFACVTDARVTGMSKSNRGVLGEIDSEVVAAILEVMFLANELRRRANERTDRRWAERHESEVEARAPCAVIDDIHGQYPPRKLLSERGEPFALGQHLGREAQKARCRGHLDLHFLPRADGETNTVARNALRAICKVVARIAPRQRSSQWIEGHCAGGSIEESTHEFRRFETAFRYEGSAQLVFL